MLMMRRGLVMPSPFSFAATIPAVDYQDVP
jgi:hypothetical protein